MHAAIEPLETEAETDAADNSALRLMLSYVEAECRRIGATEAARHAAMAAALMPEDDSRRATPPARPFIARLH
jgi:hypothetical protein